MMDDEILEFTEMLKVFAERASVEELNYIRRESTRQYNKSYVAYKAKELGVDLDYYMSEFHL